MKHYDVAKGMPIVEIDTGDKGYVTDTFCEYSSTGVWVRWSEGHWWIDAEEIEPEHVPTQQPSLANTKIDVQKYADTYGLTLDEAHREIQPWLFAQGCNWQAFGAEINLVSKPQLYLDKNYHITQTNDEYHFYHGSSHKEITLLRNVSVSLSIAPTEPSVEIDGKQYTKAQLLDALAKLEGSNAMLCK